jgi:uncharacterized delta-60 repeat protein
MLNNAWKIGSRSIKSSSSIFTIGAFSHTNPNLNMTNRIVRINTDASYDSTFIPSSSINNSINTIAIQNDQKIVCGTFSSPGIFRLNTSGSLDTSFNNGQNGFNNTLLGIAIQSDGKILAGGIFTSYNGTSINRIVRLNTDGSIDSSFNIGSGFNNWVYSVAIQNDGKILAGGIFTSYNGTSINRIDRKSVV